MEKIINVIEHLEDLRYLKGASSLEIENAEKELNLKFSVEYKKYLMEYGVISAKKVELTGIVKSSRLNVVELTKSVRESKEIKQDLYVVENLAIDGLLILQNSKGEIFELQSSPEIKKLYDSLSEYIETEYIY